jgi:hypothetical protein
MAVHTISRSGNNVTINATTAEFSRQYSLFVRGDVLKVVELNGSFSVDLDTSADTITVNGNSFTGTAEELKTLILGEVFYYWTDPSLPYLSYVGLLRQSGTNQPFIDVFHNTLGGTPVWSRDSAGVYFCTLAGAFPIETTVIFITAISWQFSAPHLISVLNDTTPDRLVMYTTDLTGAYTDDAVNEVSIEIRVYPAEI